MPLTTAEKAVTRAILSYLTEEETFFLAETVSQRIVRAASLSEAEEIVLEFSHDFEQLLKRQKMRREYLLRFIIENRLPNTDLVNAEKRTLINEIIQFTASGGVVVDDDSGASTQNGVPARSTTTKTKAMTPTSSAGAASVERTPSAPASLDVVSMAPLFAKWFYAMLNSFPQQQQQQQQQLTHGSSVTTNNNNSFGPHHFVENCRLNFCVRGVGGGGGGGGGVGVRSDVVGVGGAAASAATATATAHSETVIGGRAVAERLAQICLVDEIVFQPNLDADVCKGNKEPHGLVMLQVSGTLFRGGGLFGVFDQTFGLIKDPQTDNWKIQVSNLALQTGQSSAQRALPSPTPSGMKSLAG